MTLFHRSLDRAILLVTLLRRLRLRKIDFGTFQLGIAQLVPRVSGSPLPPPRPPKLAKKKKFRKKFRTRPPPLPLLIGNRRERSEKISSGSKKFPEVTERVPAGHKTSRWRQTTLNFLPGAGPRARCRERSSGSSNQTRTVHQRSTNQIRPHCTATYLGQLSLHLPHKVAPALFGPRLLCFALSNPPE